MSEGLGTAGGHTRSGSIFRRIGPVRATVAILVALVVLPVAAHVAYGIVYYLYSARLTDDLPFRTGFESGDLGDWSSLGAQQLCCPHSATVVDDPVRSGSHALQVTADSRDPYVKGSPRAEFRLKADWLGEGYGYAFSLYVPDDWTAIPDSVVFAQWHGTRDRLFLEGGRVPVLKLVIEEDEFRLRGAWDDDLVTKTAFAPKGAPDVEKALYWTAPLERGHWIDWRVRARWAPGESGYLEVLKDGERVFTRAGPNAFNDLLGPYFKMGVYVSDWKSRYGKGSADGDRRTLYFDDVAVTSESLPAVPPDVTAAR